jgi:hypothetical protein
LHLYAPVRQDGAAMETTAAETLLREFFDDGTLTRGREYGRRVLVVSR